MDRAVELAGHAAEGRRLARPGREIAQVCRTVVHHDVMGRHVAVLEHERVARADLHRVRAVRLVAARPDDVYGDSAG